MADNKAALTFSSLPLEVRHTIFEYAASRDVKTKHLLRYWFEKKDVTAQIATLATSDPTGSAPRIQWVVDEYGEDSDVSDTSEDEADDQEFEIDEGDEDQDDGEDEEEDGEEEEEDEEDEDEEDENSQDGMIEDEDEDEEGGADEDEEDEAIAADHEHGDDADAEMGADTGNIHHHSSHMAQDPMQSQATTGSEGVQLDSDSEISETELDPNHDSSEHMTGATDEVTEAPLVPSATANQRSRPPGPIVSPNRKWRHIPHFMRITHCPPPVEMLLASKQLNEEVKAWYYDVAVLRIQATASFAHTSFFEEAFSQITEAAFSPMENIRKAEVTFAWDSTWIRADMTGCVEAIFPALLRQRSEFVYQILSQAPDLKEVVIHWHDSADDGESASLRLDLLDRYYSLAAEIQVVEHYIAPEVKPRKTTIAGKRRLEFQSILDMGLDRLFL